MKSRILSKSKTVLETVAEKVMEWTNFLYSLTKIRGARQRSLVEVYTIKEQNIECGYIQKFLKERSRIIRLSSYSMSIVIDSNYKESTPGEIGKVTLYSNGKYIDEAKLLIKENDNNENRIIYWKFDK